MVIGEGQLLTPSDIRQLRRVPEFVFINCCHLGHIEAGAVAGDAKFRQAVLNRRDFHLFAANVATEFIRMGVKAVVAAGWAVDDASAGAFANTIYRELLKGESFGAAVKTARANTLKSHAYSNTWGAYQCYGDPSYHLVAREPDSDREDAGAERADAIKKAPILATWSSEVELINEIRNRSQRLSILAANADRKEHREWLKRLADELLPEQKDQPRPADEAPREPASADAGKSDSTSAKNPKSAKGAAQPKRRKPAKKNSQLYAALASALSDAGEFNLASELYHVAIALEDGAASVKNIEQLANLLVRRAALEAIRTDAKAEDITHRLADIDRAIGLFKWLNARPDFGSTLNDAADREIELPKQSSERASLLGSAYKRRFWLEPANVSALEDGCNWYEKAWKLTQQASPEQPDPYPLINWHFLNLISAWLDATGDTPEFDLKPADRALALRTDPNDVWTAANRVDIELLRLLIDATRNPTEGARKLLDGIDS
ncbi:MAG TPA: CHAT domain-containing protein, partial [Pirellulaceae bacterium]|nr:CHAT domain-containing protein [Pirellulaceae bacterium]